MNKVLIIGAGISGLFFANLLRQNSDYDITIYEKNNFIDLNEGYGIQLSVNSVKLLNKIGFKDLSLLTKFNPKKLDFYSLVDKKKICDLNISEFNSSDVKYTTIRRSRLVQFLKDKLPANLIRYNKAVKQIDYKKEIIKLTMEDDSIIECNYLVVSDGVFSSTRSLVSKKNINNKYFNSIAIRGIINKKNINKIDLNNISLLLGRNLHLVIYPVDQSEDLNFIAILKKKLTKNELENYSLFGDENFLSIIFKELSTQIEPNILNNIQNMKSFPIFISNEVYDQKHEKIFVIGDAFFTFPPSLAQGASQSIQTAYDLYRMFENDGDKFINKISKRVKKISRRSKINNFAFHLSNPFMVFIRNTLMCYLVKNKKFLNLYLGKIYNEE